MSPEFVRFARLSPPARAVPSGSGTIQIWSLAVGESVNVETPSKGIVFQYGQPSPQRP